MGLPDGHVDGWWSGWPGRDCWTTRRAAARPPTLCARNRRSWTGCGPTSRRSPWSLPNRARPCAGWRPAAHCACRCGARAGWARCWPRLLAGAGVGQVDVRDGGCVEPWDVAPGGLPVESIGERRDEAARRAVRRAAPNRPPRRGSAQPGSRREDPGLSLVIIAPRDGLAVHAPDPSAAEPLIDSGTPHLYAGVVEGTGVVGPLVLPGETACAGCLDLGAPTGTRPGHACWHSGVPASPVTYRRVIWRCPPRSPGWPRGMRSLFWTGSLPSSAGARWEVSVPGLRLARDAGVGASRMPLRGRGER
jgi:hypothetical protein